jgi:predicted HTH transcriptional regulator
MAKSGNPKLAQPSAEQLLTDAELIIDGRLTYAALILFGRRPALTSRCRISPIRMIIRSLSP